METNSIIYKIGSATTDEVYQHLAACNDNFIPPLSTRINIGEYSEKIARLSLTFEAWQQYSLVGLIATYVNDPLKQTAFITNVSVIRELMGKGVASALLKMLLTYATEESFKDICLEVNKENVPAIAFYEKFNFLKDKMTENYLIMKRKMQTV